MLYGSLCEPVDIGSMNRLAWKYSPSTNLLPFDTFFMNDLDAVCRAYAAENNNREAQNIDQACCKVLQPFTVNNLDFHHIEEPADGRIMIRIVTTNTIIYQNQATNYCGLGIGLLCRYLQATLERMKSSTLWEYATLAAALQRIPSYYCSYVTILECFAWWLIGYFLVPIDWSFNGYFGLASK